MFPASKRDGWNRILVELDSCQIRTGICVPSEKEELTPIRRIKRCQRPTEWREVRVGLARRVEQKDQCTFVVQLKILKTLTMHRILILSNREVQFNPLTLNFYIALLYLPQLASVRFKGLWDD